MTEDPEKTLFDAKPINKGTYHHPSVLGHLIPNKELIKQLFGVRLAPIIPTPVPEVKDKDYVASQDEIKRIKAHFDLLSGAKIYNFPVTNLDAIEEIQKGKPTKVLDVDLEVIRIIEPKNIRIIHKKNKMETDLNTRFKEWLARNSFPMDERCLDNNWWFYRMMKDLFITNVVNARNLERLTKIAQRDRERLREAADGLNHLYFMLMNLIKNTPQIASILKQDKDTRKTLEFCEDVLEKYWYPNYEGITTGTGKNSQSGVPLAEQSSLWTYDPLEARESLINRRKEGFSKLEQMIEAQVNARVIAMQEGKPVSEDYKVQLRKEYKRVYDLMGKNLPTSNEDEDNGTSTD